MWEVVVIVIAGLVMTASVVRSFFDYLLKRNASQLGNTSSNAADHTTAAEVAALRSELAQMRETSTQYDLSLQQLLENIDDRVARLEAKTRHYTIEPADQQTLTPRS